MVLLDGGSLPVSEEELDAVFTILDPTFIGYLTVQQLQDFHYALYSSTIDNDQVVAAVDQVCGTSSKGRCDKQHFLATLLELNRRMNLEQKLWWDFKVLDKSGTCTISTKDALFLLKATHGEKFSMHMWNAFMKSRDFSNDAVSFHEILMWLCSIPDGPPADDEELKEQAENLDTEKLREEYKDHKKLKLMQEDDQMLLTDYREKEDYRDQFTKGSKKKYNRWDKGGVEALIFDDGTDYEENTIKARDRVRANDILDSLEYKYEMLRQKLFRECIQSHVGETFWSTMSESEQQEMVMLLDIKEKKFRKEYQMDKLGALAETAQTYPHRLVALIGDLIQIHESRKVDDENHRTQLISDGCTEDEVNERLLKSHQELIEGSTTGGELLSDLHSRHMMEREYLLSKLRMENDKTLNNAEIITVYVQIIRQQKYAESEALFENSSIAVGIAERPQLFKSPKFDSDRNRQEKLAIERLQNWKKRKVQRFEDESITDNKNKGIVELQVDVIKIAVRKHTHEREILITMLQGKESSSAKTAGRRLNKEQREKRLKELCGQRSDWRESSSQYMISKRNLHRRLLQEGVGIYQEVRREEIKNGHNLDDLLISANVLADLQQKQDREINLLLTNMQNKSASELRDIKRSEERAVVEEWLDNVSSVVLGTFDLSQEERELIKALENKYDVIRDKLLTETLKRHYGADAWKDMLENEQQRLLSKKKLEERSLRQEGKLDEMAALVGDFGKNEFNLEELMGRIQTEYHQKYLEKQSRIQKEDEDVTDYEIEEPLAVKKIGNPLGDLQYRFSEDMDTLMGKLKGEEGVFLREQGRIQLLQRWKRQRNRAEKEEKFLDTVLMIGLAERIPINIDMRVKKDKTRNFQLARERYSNREHRKSQGLYDELEFDNHVLPPKGELETWKESMMIEVDKRHRMERNLMMSILTDKGSEELREVARSMPDDERQKRLAELKRKREGLELDSKDDQEQNLDILEESGAIKSVVRRLVMEEEAQGKIVSHGEIVVSLLAELQEEQEREGERIFLSLDGKTEDDISGMRYDQITRRKIDRGDNIMEIFSMYEGAGQEDELIKALEEKYDVLKDRLLCDALRRQMSEEDWLNLSDEEKKRRLLKLKLEERRLQRDGKHDALVTLLGDNFHIQGNVSSLMGEHQSKYKQKLIKRLAKKKPDVAENDGILEDEGERKKKSTNTLLELHDRYRDERDVLMTNLRDPQALMNKKERQACLIKLKREKQKAEREEGFEAAALAVGLAERKQSQFAERLQHDRERQEDLARRRITFLRKKKTEIQSEDDQLVNSGNRADMQDAVLRALENKHAVERQVLLEILQQDGYQQFREFARIMTEVQRQDKLDELVLNKQELDSGDVNGMMEILKQAAIIKMCSRHSQLERLKEGIVEKDDVIVSISADLQEQQDKESEQLIERLPEQDLSTLIRWQEEQIKERKEKKNDNIVIILLRRDECNKTGEDELVEALKDKYDVLRDKLIAEALMKQMSEAEWNRLSEKERQERILKMKLELRRLLEEGKQDEVARLLGDVIETQNALESLMGENRAEYERKLKERLARRKARLAKGMSESEVIKLESIEELAEEEELKKKPKPKNILKDLDRRYDEEKAALLASLKGQDDRLLSERLRQAELSRLKREQRITREEDKFEAAAILLGLAEHYGDVEARKRLRQEELAKQRLAERKNRRADAKKRLATIEEEVVTMPENEDDVIALQDAVLNEVNKKHRAERELLIALLQEQENSKHKKTAKDMNEDELYNKLNELKSYRAQWRESSSDPSQQIQIFEEAIAMAIEVRIAELAKLSAEGTSSESDAEISLLADLQQEQDKESRHLMADLHSQSAATLRQLKQAEMIARSQKWYDNVASIMFGIAHQQLTSEDELVEALEEKYDALRDKLLAEALMRQFSETQWAKMSEKERQAKLMKLKLEEKRLRREGKFDEAAALLGDSFKNDEELARILGESEKTQKERLKERLERRRQLKAERKAEGLPVDDKSLDEILDAEEEEEKKRRRNILLELNNHFEDEKDALMAALRAQDKRLMSERERQLALAKLRRDQLKLKKEDSFETAAVLYGIAQDNEAKRQTGVGKDRERQRQLARQRLAAAKKKRSTKNALKKAALEKKLKQDEEENVKSDAMLALRRQQEGVAVLQEAVLTELEKKHKTESDMLLILINHAEENKKEKEAAKKLSDEELNKKLRKLESKRDRWRRQSQKDADIADYHNLSPSELGKHLTKLAANQEKQYDILEVAVLLKMEELRRSTAADGSVPEKNIESEVQVKLLSDVQEKQQAESNAMSKILGSDKAERIFEKLKEDQRRARREGWFDNMASSVLDSDPLQVTRSESMISIRSEDIHELEGEIEDLDIKHERNIQEVKERARREGNKIDANAMLAELERQHAAKKKAMKEQLEKQKQKMKERLAAKKHAKDEKEYEEVIALALLKNAERTLKLQEQKDSEEKDRQGIMMKEKLKSRREQRREAQNARDEAQTMKEHEELEKKKREMDAEKRLVEEEAAKHPQKLTSAKKSDVYPDLPGGPMRRQKTVVDINVSEEKKKQILSTLVSEQTKAQQTIEKEQMKQAEMLKEKLEKHKSRRQDEAAAVVGLGARQKTILEKTQKDERERQITMVKERIARVRYERTMTMKERANKNTADFEKMLSPDDPNGTPSDEKMSKLAADLNQRFKKDEMDIKKGVKSMLAEDNVPEGKSKPKKTVTIDDGTKSSRKIDDKEKERIMKERLAQRRKKQFVKKGSLAAAPDMDTLSKRIQEQNASEKNEGE